MFYPDLEENSSRGIKSGAISKYQRNVCLYPAAFTLWLILLTKLLLIFLIANLPWQWIPKFREQRRAGTDFREGIMLDCSKIIPNFVKNIK